MKKIKVKNIYKKALALMAIPFILTGCSKKSECNITANHVHLYTKKANNAIIENYLHSEDINNEGYEWHEDCIEVTREDLDFYKTKGTLFEGANNWDYLYNVMASKKDYLEFYYYYTEDGVMSIVDAEGNVSDMPYTDTYKGWSKDPKHRGVTGKTRVVHHRFFGYKIIKKNGKYELEKSKSVDDIRSIIDEYPYFTEDCTVKVNKEYNLNENSLVNVKLEDIDEYTGPDLSNRELNNNTK